MTRQRMAISDTDRAHRSEVGMQPVTLRVTNGTDCGLSEPSA